MSYFAGEGRNLGVVRQLGARHFLELCAGVAANVAPIPLTREEFHALPKRDKDAPLDQDRAKRVDYLVACEFANTPSDRRFEHAGKCNLIFLDIDNSDEAKRLLTQRWEDLLPGLAFVVWHTASSRPDAPRLRVMVSASGIARDRYPAAVRTVGEMLGLPEVTRESRVVVQPMFYPTSFVGDPPFEWVASHPDGAAFSDADIIADGDSALVDQPMSEQVVADLRIITAPLEGVTNEEIQGALDRLDPDASMQSWIEIGAALKHQFGETDEAFALWNNWSAKGKKYDGEEETRYRWSTLRATPPDRAPITLRTLLHRAMARGWENPALALRLHSQVIDWVRSPSRSAEELLDQGAKRVARVAQLVGSLQRQNLLTVLRDRLREKNVPLTIPDLKRAVKDVEREAIKRTGLPAWTKGLCFITSTGQFFRHTTGRTFAPEVLDLIYQLPAAGDDKPPRARDYAIQVAGIPQVETERYDPARKERFFTEGNVPYLNTYRSNAPAPDPAGAAEAEDLMLPHLHKLIGQPDYVQTMMDFAAYHVQKPGCKIRWAPLVQSTKGAGKTVFAVMLSAVLGRGNVKKLGPDNVIDRKYNEWCVGSQLVVMEEVRIVGQNRHAVMDRLKPCISDDEVSVDRKWADLRSVPNITNYLMFTNYADALAISDDERRYFVVASSIQTLEQVLALGGDPYFTKLYNGIRDNASGFRAWLENWKISPSFSPEGRAPLTEHLREMARHAASPLAAAVRDAIHDQDHALVGPRLVSMQALRPLLANAGLGHFSDQALASVLREAGFVRRDRIRLGEERHSIWTAPDVGSVDACVAAQTAI